MFLKHWRRDTERKCNWTKVTRATDFADNDTPDFFCSIIAAPKLITRVVINDADMIFHSFLRLHTPLPCAKEISCCLGPSIMRCHPKPYAKRCRSAEMLPVCAVFEMYFSSPCELWVTFVRWDGFTLCPWLYRLHEVVTSSQVVRFCK